MRASSMSYSLWMALNTGTMLLVVQDSHETGNLLGTDLRTLEPILGHVGFEHRPLQTHPMIRQGLGLCGQHAHGGRVLGTISGSAMGTKHIEVLVHSLRVAERPDRCLRDALLVVPQIACSPDASGVRAPAAATATRSARLLSPGCPPLRTPDRCTPDHSLSRCGGSKSTSRGHHHKIGPTIVPGMPFPSYPRSSYPILLALQMWQE